MKRNYMIMLMMLPALYITFPQQLNLDIDTSIAMALKNNLNIERGKIQLNKYTWAMATSWNKFVPNASIDFSLTHLDDQSITKKYPQLITDTSIPHLKVSDDATLYNGVIQPNIPAWAVSMGLNVSFNLNAAMVFGVYQTVLDWKSGKLNLETAEKKLNKDVKRIYYNMIILKENLNLINDKTDEAKKRYDQAIINRQTGVSTKIDELKAKADYENMKPEYLDGENAYKQALLNFKQMIGLKDEVEPILTSNIPDIVDYNFDYQDLLNRYINKTLEIQALNLNLNALRNQRNINISALTPSFFISYIYDPYYMKDPFDPKNSNWFSDVNNDWIERTGALTFGFSIPLNPSFPFSAEQMKLVTNEFSIRDAFKAIEQLKLDTKLNIQKIVLNMQKSLKAIDVLKTNIELSEEVYSMTNEAYKVGTKKLLDVEDAENGLDDAKLNLLRQQFEYISNLLELEYSLNVKIDDILKDKNYYKSKEKK